MTALDAAVDAELDAATATEVDAAAGRGEWHSSSSECTSFSSAIARVCRLKLCDIKVWTLAEVSWIEIHESKVNKIIITQHTSERRLYMFIAVVSH